MLEKDAQHVSGDQAVPTVTHSLHTLDYVAIGAYLLTLASLGLVLGRLIKDVGAYFKGGGTLPWPAAALSNFAAMLSTFIFVAYAGLAYKFGLVAIAIFWSTVPPTLFAAAIIGKRWRRAGIMTPVEYLETRFNAPVRQFLGWCGMAFRVVDNMVRLFAVGLFMAAATGLRLEYTILLAGAVTLACTVSGGLWAVVLIDVVQFVVLIFSTLIMVPLSLRAAGGLGALMNAIPDHFTFFRAANGEQTGGELALFFVAYYMMVLIKYNGNWSFIQRFYSVRDEAAGRKMAITMAVLFFITPFFFLLPPIAARVVVPGLEQLQVSGMKDGAELAYVAIAQRVLPSGIMGLLMAAMFASTITCVAAEFNVTASVFTRDVYHRLLRRNASPSELMWAARGATFVIGALVIVGAMFVGRLGGAFKANLELTALAIPLSVPLVLGILLRRARPWGAFAAIAVGIPLGLFLKLHIGLSTPVNTLTSIVVSVGILLISGLIPSRDPAYIQRVNEFFARLARPIPEDEKPETDPAFQHALVMLFAAAFACTGTLFVSMSLFSIGQFSGWLALTAGVVSLGLSLGIYYFLGRRTQSKTVTQASSPVAEQESALRR